MSEDEPIDNEQRSAATEKPASKDRSLLYMAIILGSIILVMGYLALFVDDPSSLFKKNKQIEPVVSDEGSLNETESMSDEEVKKSLTKFIEAFYYDQRRGYFHPPSYFAVITQTFYIYHNLTHERLKDLYWQRQGDLANFSRNWIVSSLDFERRDSRIIATYWAKESYFKKSTSEQVSGLIKYELVINDEGKIVSMKEIETKNMQVFKVQRDSTTDLNLPAEGGTTEPGAAGSDKVYDLSQVEVQPEFSGGKAEFAKYVGVNLKYPVLARQNNVQGKVILSFIIEKDGQITDVKVKQGIGSGCDEEAVRVMRNSPKWRPGLVNEEPVRTFYMLPITFQY